jgi:hypothetical protein
VAHYADLSPCTYFGDALRVPKLLAVGWLDPANPYATGDPGRDVYDRLQEFRSLLAWQPVLFCVPAGLVPLQ